MTKKRSTIALVRPGEIQNLVHVIRGQRVMLDSDLARLYAVTTMRLNEQVGRNRDRFFEDFAYQLTQHEVGNLKSKFVTSNRRRCQGYSWPFPPQAVPGPCFSTGAETRTQPVACPPRPDRRRRSGRGGQATYPEARFRQPDVNVGPNTACGGNARKRACKGTLQTTKQAAASTGGMVIGVLKSALVDLATQAAKKAAGLP